MVGWELVPQQMALSVYQVWRPDATISNSILRINHYDGLFHEPPSTSNENPRLARRRYSYFKV